jgi:hypothetical protein
MSIRTRLLAVIRAAASVRNVKAEPAPQIIPVFAAPMTVTRQDDILAQVAMLRHQGYSLRAVAAEMGVSYRQARKMASQAEPVIW